MSVRAEKVAEEALGLPMKGRALLVEKLLASLAGKVNSQVERENLIEIESRRSDVRSGKTELVDGPEGLLKARSSRRK